MKVRPEQLVPSQDFLKPGTIAFIFTCIQNGEFEQLPPDPIVRKGENDEIIAIDGHNLIAVKLHLGQELEVHMAHSSQDGLPPTTEANRARNKDLAEKFDFVLGERSRLHTRNIDTFQDLIDHYPELFPSQGT
jgi:hypothetical protein